jgi:hypothetical protein
MADMTCKLERRPCGGLVGGPVVKVQEFWRDDSGEMLLSQWCFDTERDARRFINAYADGSTTYTLWVNHEVVVESSWPVMMVA